MKTRESTAFLQGELYEDPKATFRKALESLGMGDDQEIQGYLQRVLGSSDAKNNDHQQAIRPILERLIATGEKEKAGLLFNIHRLLTEFAGYGVNEKASSDVDACFAENSEIPDEGMILVDFFVTRNLPKIMSICEKRGIDISRIRVHAPRALLALQIMLMSDEKRTEFEEACGKLTESQFRTQDVYHVGDTQTDEQVAIWFSPRTMPIHPRLHAETESETVENYIEEFRAKVANVVPGGRIYANLAFSEMWQPLQVETETKKRALTKLTGISREVATRIVSTLLTEGFSPVAGPEVEEFNPADRNANTDHGKLAQELYLKRSS